MENYSVHYGIYVDSASATAGLTQLTSQLSKMQAAEKRLQTLASASKTLSRNLDLLRNKEIRLTFNAQTKTNIDLLSKALERLELMSSNMKGRQINIDTTAAVKSLTTLDEKLAAIESKIAYLNTRGVTFPPMGAGAQSKGGNKGSGTAAATGAATGAAGTTTKKGTKATKGQTQAANKAIATGMAAPAPNGLKSRTSGNVLPRYIQSAKLRSVIAAPPYAVNNKSAANALGHAEIVSPMMLNMLKGMGIAYGISAISSGISSVVKDATSYNNMMQTTRNILGAHDKSPGFAQSFRSMEKVVRNVGIQTKFTAPEVADAARYLAMAGLNAGTIKTAMPSVANLALIGDTNLGATADVITNIITAYDMPAQNIANAADIMTQTFTSSNTTLMELAESYKYAASLMSAAGVDMAESAGAFGVLGDAGIKASSAGTTMRMILNNLLKPTKAQAAVWKKLGIERFETDANGNSTGQLRSLLEIFKELNQLQQNGKLTPEDVTGLFRITAASGAMALIKRAGRWDEIATQNRNADGIAEELANAKKNTIQGLWAQVTSSFTEQGLRVFEGKQGSLMDKLRQLTSWMQSNRAATLFQEWSDRFIDLGKTMVNFTTLLGRVANAFAGPIQGFLKLELVLGSFAIAARAIKSVVNVFGMIGSGVQKGLNANYGATNWVRNNLGQPLGWRIERNHNSISNGQFATTNPYYWHPGAQRLYQKYYSQDTQYTNSQLRSRLANWNDIYPVADERFRGRGILTRKQLLNASVSADAGMNYYRDINALMRTRAGRKIYNSYRVRGADPNTAFMFTATKAKLIDRYQRMYGKKLPISPGVGVAMQNAVGATGGMALGAIGGYLGAQMSDDPMTSLLGATTLGTAGYFIPSIIGGITGLGAVATGGIGIAVAGVATLITALVKNKQASDAAATSMLEYGKSVATINGLSINSDDEFIKYMALVSDNTKNANDRLREYINLRMEELGLGTNNADNVPDKQYKNINPANAQEIRDLLKGGGMAVAQVWEESGKLFEWATNAENLGQAALTSQEYKDLLDPHKSNAQIAANIVQQVIARQQGFATAASMNEIFLNRLSNARTDEDRQKMFESYMSQIWDVRVNGAQAENSYANLHGVKRGEFTPWGLETAYQSQAKGMMAQYNALKDAFDGVAGGNMAGLPKVMAAYGSVLFKDVFSNQTIKDLEKSQKEYKAAVDKKMKEVKNLSDSELDTFYANEYQADIERVKKAFNSSPMAQLASILEVKARYGMLGVAAALSANQQGEEKYIGDYKYRWDNQSQKWWLNDENAPSMVAQVYTDEQAKKMTGTDIINDEEGPLGANTYSQSSASPRQVILNIENLMNVDSVDMSAPGVAATLDNLRSQMAEVLMGVVSDFSTSMQYNS